MDVKSAIVLQTEPLELWTLVKSSQDNVAVRKTFKADVVVNAQMEHSIFLAQACTVVNHVIVTLVLLQAMFVINLRVNVDATQE